MSTPPVNGLRSGCTHITAVRHGTLCLRQYVFAAETRSALRRGVLAAVRQTLELIANTAAA